MTSYNNLRDVLHDYDRGRMRGYGDFTKAFDTLVLALRRRDKTISELRKQLRQESRTAAIREVIDWFEGQQIANEFSANRARDHFAVPAADHTEEGQR